MRRSVPSPETGRTHRLPEWVVPWSTSLGLHLLLLLALASWHRQPREIIWVNLLEARLLPAGKEESRPQAPAATAQRPRAAPVANRLPTARERSATAPAAAPLPSPPATPPAASAAALADSKPETAGSGVSAVAQTPASVEGNRAEGQTAAAGSPEQRYVREQFAYIRDKVMQRLSYPPMARRQGWQGTVRVAFTVRADGSIDGLHVDTGSGHLLLDRQALRAVESAAPFPAPPAPAAITLPVLFSLEPTRP